MGTGQTQKEKTQDTKNEESVSPKPAPKTWKALAASDPWVLVESETKGSEAKRTEEAWNVVDGEKEGLSDDEEWMVVSRAAKRRKC